MTGICVVCKSVKSIFYLNDENWCDSCEAKFHMSEFELLGLDVDLTEYVDN